MSILEFGLGIAGMSDKQIADVKAALPVTASILDEAAELEPILEQARPRVEAMIPHIVALAPLLPKAWPIILKMWPQIVAETPVAQEIVAFVRSKS